MEELKYIVENVLPALETGGVLVIGYLYLKPILTFLFFLIFLVVAYKLANRLINQSFLDRACVEISRELGFPTISPYYRSNHYDVMERIKKLIELERQTNGN